MALSIGFDATAAVHQGAGIGRYTRQLLGALATMESEDRFRVIYCSKGSRAGEMPPLGPRFRVRSLPASDRIMNAIWHRARVPLPLQAIMGRVDVFHSPDFTLPPVPGTPKVLTVHDLAFLTVPECSYPTLREYLRKVVPRSARRASRIIAVSESTRKDVIELLDIPPHRVVTVYEAGGNEFRPLMDQERALQSLSELGVRQPYILTVGTLEPRKNYSRLFEAFAVLKQRRVDHTLVVAGRDGWMYEPALQRLHELGLGNEVHIIAPNDSQLNALYGLADLFVYPSLYEGFGIPPLEAMACGTPVACSGTSSLPEVVGDAGLLFDPKDVEAMSETMLRLLSDSDLRRHLRVAGPARAATFSWERAARETALVYHEAASA